MGIREKFHDGERIKGAFRRVGLHDGERLREAGYIIKGGAVRAKLGAQDLWRRSQIESKFPSPPGMKPLTRLHDGARVKAALGKVGRGAEIVGKGSALIIKGSAPYVSKMARHLKKEHPSTRRRMKVSKFYRKTCGTKRRHPCVRYGTARCPYCKRYFKLGR